MWNVDDENQVLVHSMHKERYRRRLDFVRSVMILSNRLV
jgi:hypothetical protein